MQAPLQERDSSEAGSARMEASPTHALHVPWTSYGSV